MSVDNLLEMAPLLQGRLRDQTDEICNGYVEWAVFSDHCSEVFEANDIVEIISSEVGIELDKMQIVAGLDRLVDENAIDHQEDFTYVRTEERELDEIHSIEDDCWEEYGDVLDEHPREIDVHYLDDDIEPAFREFLRKYAARLEEETEILTETQQDVIYTANIAELIDEIIRDASLEHSEVFKECLIDYLRNPGEAIKSYVGVVYIAIVNTDLMERQEVLDLPNVPEDEKVIFFDANVIQDLLCKSDREHPLIRTAVERSRRLDFDLYYFPETVDDLQSSIDGAIREMGGLKKKNYSNETFENQFLKDWHRRFRELRDEALEWSEYRNQIQRWQLEVEGTFSLTQYEGSADCQEEDLEFAKEIIDRIGTRRGRPKRPPVLEHDGKILAKTAELRGSVEGAHNIGPVLLTLDNSITEASDYAYQQNEYPEGVAIPPRTWFNYLLTFTSAEFDHLEVGEVIINVSARIDSTPSIEEYAKALEVKAGFETGNADLLAKYLRFSEYSDELERSLRRNDGAADEWAFLSLDDSEAMEQFTEAREQRRRLREMGAKMQELKEENKRLRESGDGDVYNFVAGGSAEASATAQATATAESRVEFEAELRDFVELYRESVPEELQEEIPPPPDDVSNLERFREWLDTAVSVVSAAEATTAGLSVVSSYGQRLLAEISNYI